MRRGLGQQRHDTVVDGHDDVEDVDIGVGQRARVEGGVPFPAGHATPRGGDQHLPGQRCVGVFAQIDRMQFAAADRVFDRQAETVEPLQEAVVIPVHPQADHRVDGLEDLGRQRWLVQHVGFGGRR